MDISFDLLINAIVAGLLLGGFYAAVTAGVSISFGMLDIVNIAHPAFIILGSYLAYFININFGVDPILVSIIMLPVFFALGMVVYQVYYLSFERRWTQAEVRCRLTSAESLLIGAWPGSKRRRTTV